MQLQPRTTLLRAGLVLTFFALTAVSSFASTITLGISGDARVGANYLDFGSYPQGDPYVASPGFGTFEVTSPITNLFSANGVTPGEFGLIRSFDSTLERVATILRPPVEFMTFNTGGSNLQLFVTQVYQGNARVTPPSPFILFNTPVGANAAFDVGGYVLNTNDGSETFFTGVFSATFSGMTVAELLASLPVETTFSATFSLTTIPEPVSMLLVGIGLLGLGIIGRKRLARS
jgi:hypothetical protein